MISYYSKATNNRNFYFASNPFKVQRKCYNLFPSFGKTTVGLNVLASSKSICA
jgi:hypothetical protein